MTEPETTLAKVPITYEPSLRNDNYVDCVTRYSWREIQDLGMKCPCSKGVKIYRNKNSFQFQHCGTKKHKTYIEQLNKEIPEQQNKDDDEFKKEIKKIKIQLGKEHEAYQLQKQLNENLQRQIKSIIGEKEELQEAVKQSAEYAQEMTDRVTELEATLKKYETITQAMMKLGGYEVI